MAGSFSMIVGENGKFTMESIENMGDAFEALHECFEIIRALTGGKKDKINERCKKAGFSGVDNDMKPSGWDTGE